MREPVPNWTADVIEFLSRNIPPIDPHDPSKGWDHMFSTAYQVGCEALVALGQADEKVWGATPRANPQLPEVLPRWDDICIAVLWLSDQQNLLEYRLLNGDVPQQALSGGWVVTQKGATAPPPPNISSAHGLGPAYAKQEVIAVWNSLGLVATGAWTKAAECILWRTQPREWRMDIASDPRFIKASIVAHESIPKDIGAEMDRIVTISDAEINAILAKQLSNYKLDLAKNGHNTLTTMRPPTRESVLRMLRFEFAHKLDWLFFRRWRFPDGWLTKNEASKALKIFHDPLAIEMRKAVTAKRYQHLTFLQE